MQQHKEKQRRRIVLMAIVTVMITSAAVPLSNMHCIETETVQEEETELKSQGVKTKDVTAGVVTVLYDSLAQEYEHETVTIKAIRTEIIKPYIDLDDDESYLLTKIAMAEAEGEDTEGKALVMLTVLNRVRSDKFPDTIEGVITEKDAFTSYTNGRYDAVEPNADCFTALELIQMQNWNESHEALYFERTTDESTWHNRNLKKLFVHGNHTFYTDKEDESE